MKTVLITGANRGIGLEFSKQYAAADWQVIAACRQPKLATALETLSAASHHRLQILPLDVTNMESLQALKKTIGDQPIDVLINNAGILGAKRENGESTEADRVFGSLYLAPENALKIFEVNVLGPLFLSELLVDNLARSERKMIINISSDRGSMTINKTGAFCLYQASKAALNAITVSASVVLQPRGITIVAIHPGWVQTDMGGATAPLTVTESVQHMRTQIEKLHLEQTGSYIKYTGEVLPW